MEGVGGPEEEGGRGWRRDEGGREGAGIHKGGLLVVKGRRTEQEDGWRDAQGCCQCIHRGKLQRIDGDSLSMFPSSRSMWMLNGLRISLGMSGSQSMFIIILLLYYYIVIINLWLLPPLGLSMSTAQSAGPEVATCLLSHSVYYYIIILLYYYITIIILLWLLPPLGLSMSTA